MPDFVEKAKKAQEIYEKRIDVQLSLDAERKKKMIVTNYGAHLGDSQWILIYEDFAEVIENGYEKVNEGIPYIHSSCLSDSERNMVHEAWSSYHKTGLV